jgi:chorismate dehydratase
LFLGVSTLDGKPVLTAGLLLCCTALTGDLCLQLLPQAEARNEKSGQRPRLGQINFVNCLPVHLPLTSGLVPIEADITEETPANLNSGYSTGALDLGAMSSFYYLCNQDDLVLLPGLSISTCKEVGSVLFFSKNQINKDSHIEVPASSATSVALLRLYLACVHGVEARFTASPRPDLGGKEIDAALVIGDRALTVDAEWTKQSERVDLGQWWSTNFKTPMVFGVWAARKAWYETNLEKFQRLAEDLRTARNLGLSTIFEEVLDQAQARTDLSRERLRRYFLEELDYSMSNEHEKGLQLFKEQLKAKSILS